MGPGDLVLRQRDARTNRRALDSVSGPSGRSSVEAAPKRGWRVCRDLRQL